MRQVIKHRDIRLLNMIRRTDPVIPVEANVPFNLATVDWTATAGAVPFATDFYGTTGFAVTNVALKATKEIKVTDSFSIPIFGQVVGNPCSQKAYLVIGFTLQP